ncbi:MAG: YiiX/YebB-like N1pC/P60 family cysteine hydrolase [Gemmatimonadota bacterium]
MFLLDVAGRRLARYLTAPRRGRVHSTTASTVALAQTLQVGDVLLVEGSSRISSAIKYLTQSTWSHATLCIAPPDLLASPEQEPAILLEADVNSGVQLVPLSRYGSLHTRICRPVGLTPAEITSVVQHALRRVGHRYDMKHIVDLMRYLIPNPPVPARYRRRLLAVGSGDPTRAICSALIAEAFHSVGYPILPTLRLLPPSDPEALADHKEALHIRHHSLFTPRDFDVSPYFAIVKPTLAHGFDPHLVELITDPFDGSLATEYLSS